MKPTVKSRQANICLTHFLLLMVWNMLHHHCSSTFI